MDGERYPDASRNGSDTGRSEGACAERAPSGRGIPRAAPESAVVARLMFLQRAAGNAAVTAMLRPAEHRTPPS